MTANDVDTFLATLDHARIDEVNSLREALRGLDPELNESIKWNAPSYGYGAEHRVTMRLHPGDRVELVLHRGAAKRSDAFAFEDMTGLLRWLAPDRGVVEITDVAMLKERLEDVKTLATAWLAATDDR